MSRFTDFGNRLYTGEKSIDFVGRRWLWYAVSAVIILLTIAITSLRGGFLFGIEFRGGSEFRISQPAVVDVDIAHRSSHMDNACEHTNISAFLRPTPGCSRKAMIARQQGQGYVYNGHLI